jgi:hypothetical protein
MTPLMHTSKEGHAEVHREREREKREKPEREEREDGE